MMRGLFTPESSVWMWNTLTAMTDVVVVAEERCGEAASAGSLVLTAHAFEQQRFGAGRDRLG